MRFCKALVDAFMEDSAYFRCIVVDQHRFDYGRFGRPDEPIALKRARAYKRFAEMLLAPHIEGVRNAVFLADSLKRCTGDEFLERLQECFNVPGEVPTFRHMAEVPSHEEPYQCVQVCDLLLGCVLNNLHPTTKVCKNQIREYLAQKLDVAGFLPTAWQDVPLAEAVSPETKFNVWHWRAKRNPR